MQDTYDSALFPIPHDPRPHSRLWRRVVRQACKSRQNRALAQARKYLIFLPSWLPDLRRRSRGDMREAEPKALIDVSHGRP